MIELLEIYFNSALKRLFAKELMKTAEKNLALVEEQWGLRNSRTSTYAAMLKLLLFECAKIKRSTIGEKAMTARRALIG